MQDITETAIVQDLGRLRTRGFWNLLGLDVPTVTALARVVDPTDTVNDAFKIEKILKAGIDRLGDAEYAEAAALLFGVAPRSRGLRVGDRRRLAANAYGEMAPDTLRTRHEKALIADLAGQLCGLLVPDDPPQSTPSPAARPASKSGSFVYPRVRGRAE